MLWRITLNYRPVWEYTRVNKGPGDGVREASVRHNQPVDFGELLPVLGRPAIDSGAAPKRLQARD
jgi:hypothetical protein